MEVDDKYLQQSIRYAEARIAAGSIITPVWIEQRDMLRDILRRLVDDYRATVSDEIT